MKRPSPKNEIVSLMGKGWPVVTTSVAVIRLRDRPGFAVGVQQRFRSGGFGCVWPSLKSARRRAGQLAVIHELPIVEAI